MRCLSAARIITLSAAMVATPLWSAFAAQPPAAPPNYGSIGQVQDYLGSGHPTGELVAILGFPLCSALNECRLLAGRDYISPRIPFSAVRLEKFDQDRLLHCIDPERGAKPCVVVLYGEAVAGRSVAPHRIEWRAYD